MLDPMIHELFPEIESLYIPDTWSSPESPAETPDPPLPPSLSITGINYLSGKYNLSQTLSHYNESRFPSVYAQKTFLYIQLLASNTFSCDHYTLRRELPSYLLAQTFWGKGKLRYEGKEYELNKSDLFLIDCRKEHEYFSISENGWGYRFIHFDGNIMPGYYESVRSGGCVKFHFESCSKFQELFKELFLSGSQKNVSREVIENRILTDMITEILCALPMYRPKELPDSIKMQCAWLKEHCCEKLTLEQLSEEFSLSKFYMSREFKKYTGTTIFDYIAQCRMDIALRMLRYSDAPIGEISDYVGFSDHNAFYRAFRQQTGQAPSVYRQNWKGE